MKKNDFPDTPTSRMKRQAVIEKPNKQASEAQDSEQRLKEIIRKKKGVLSLLMKPSTMIKAVAKGKIDGDALCIIQTIGLHRNPAMLVGLDSYSEKTEVMKAYLQKTKSPNPLCEEDKERILKAVCDFDRDFLQSLITAMDLFERDSEAKKITELNAPERARGSHPGVAYYNSCMVIACHEFFQVEQERDPTNRELMELLNDVCPDVQIEERVMRERCRHFRLPLAADRRGRPKMIR